MTPARRGTTRPSPIENDDMSDFDTPPDAPVADPAVPATPDTPDTPDTPRVPGTPGASGTSLADPLPVPGATPTPGAPDDAAVPAAADPAPPPQAPPGAVLDLVVVDWNGNVVPNLPVKVFKFAPDSKPCVFDGVTNAKGAAPPIDALVLGDRFEVQVRNDKGIYQFAAIGTIEARAVTGNLALPHERFKFSTYAHEGTPGTAEAQKKATGDRHVQKPDGRVDVSRNAPAASALVLARDAQGAPKAVATGGQPNMLGQNRTSVASLPAGSNAPEKVKKLLEVAMEQLAWTYQANGETVEKQMRASTFVPVPRANFKGYVNSMHRCARYVVMALWRAGWIDSNADVMPLSGLARELGPKLVSAGFTDITASLPDARWAAPGDVIVYQKIGDATAAGHVDIRSYDGYISDFWDSYLPVSQFQVTGIYRKYFDPLPEKRMRAFLKVIRSREARTLFLNQGDAATYGALPDPGIKGKQAPTFSDFSTHPFHRSGGTASGAYGITYENWTLYVPKWVSVADGADRFSPLVQDRIAVATMEQHPGQGWGAAKYQTQLVSSLALVRQDEAAKAATQLGSVKAQWTSLPGGKECRGYAMDELLSDYQRYLASQQ